jgi:hypothetical protein
MYYKHHPGDLALGLEPPVKLGSYGCLPSPPNPVAENWPFFLSKVRVKETEVECAPFDRRQTNRIHTILGPGTISNMSVFELLDEPGKDGEEDVKQNDGTQPTCHNIKHTKTRFSPPRCGPVNACNHVQVFPTHNVGCHETRSSNTGQPQSGISMLPLGWEGRV